MPLLFEAAHSGDKDLLFHVLQNGDNVNPVVSHSNTIYNGACTQSRQWNWSLAAYYWFADL